MTFKMKMIKKWRVSQRFLVLLILSVFLLFCLHVAACLALLDSFIKSAAGRYEDASYAASLSQQLATLSPTLSMNMKKAIDQQVASALAKQRPVNGVFSAFIINGLFDENYSLRDAVTAEDLINATRQINMRGDLNGVDFIAEKLKGYSESLSVSDLNELENEIAYDKFRAMTFWLKGRIGNDRSVLTADTINKLASMPAPLREMHEKSQAYLCAEQPYRCEINKIRWQVAECNYSRELSGTTDLQCVDAVRQVYLDAIGYPTRNEVVFDRCVRRFGAQGCAAMAAEIPYYMETLVIGYGAFN